MRTTRSRTKRPRGALLQLGIELGHSLCRIGGRLRSRGASLGGAAGEIPPWLCLGPNPAPLAGRGTVPGGQFDWGGRLNVGRLGGNAKGKLGCMLETPSPNRFSPPESGEGVQYPTLPAKVKMRSVRTTSREVFVTPQRLHAEHPWNARPPGMVIQSELPGDWKPENPGSNRGSKS